MTRPYSEDLRERVVRVVESGTSRNAAAKQFDVSISFVVKLMQRWKQRGTIKADKYGGWKKSNLAPHGEHSGLVMENSSPGRVCSTLDAWRLSSGSGAYAAERSALTSGATATWADCRTWSFFMARRYGRDRAANGWWRPFPMATGRQPRSLPPCFIDRNNLPCASDGPINGAASLPGSSKPWSHPVRATSSSWTTSPPTRSPAYKAIEAVGATPLPPYSPAIPSNRSSPTQSHSSAPEPSILAGNWKRPR